MRCFKMQVNIISFYQNVVNWRTNQLCKKDENARSFQTRSVHNFRVCSDVFTKLDFVFLPTGVSFSILDR